MTQTLHPSLPAVARRYPSAGSLSQESRSSWSPPSLKHPSSTKNSPPPFRSSSTEAPGAQRSSRTFSPLSANNSMVSTPLRSGSTSGVNVSFDVSMRTCFRSVGSNCQSFTKILQPVSDPGVWEDVGGLRMYQPTGKSPCSSWNTPSSTRNSSPPPWMWAEKRLFGA